MTIVPASPEAILRSAELIRTGGLVAMPTETVYGLAADATNGAAVAAIYAAKGRPRFNPLIVHVESFEAAEKLASIPAAAKSLALAYWPGPLTLVLAARPGNGIAGLVTAGLDTIAVRVPADRVARGLIAASGRPLAAPSANRSGHVSPTTAAHVAADFGDEIEIILDGGPAGHGLESTIVDASGAALVVLRPGAISSEDIEDRAGAPIVRFTGATLTPAAPGQLESHYAPKAQVRLDARRVCEGEALLAFGADMPASHGPVVNLSPTGDLAEAAQNLFAALRTLDSTGCAVIAAMPVPRHGLGEAINDRLARAAAPRARPSRPG